jgi:hypothetical protein
MTTKQKKIVETVKRKYVKKQKPVEKVVPIGWAPGDRWMHITGEYPDGRIGSIEDDWVKIQFEPNEGYSQRAIIDVNEFVRAGRWIINPPVIEQQPEPVKEKTILEEAQELVYGDRAEAYGPVSKSFNRIATGWSEIFGVPVTAEQVGYAMMWLKISRQLNKPGRDNMVDVCGYVACLDKMSKE